MCLQRVITKDGKSFGQNIGITARGENIQYSFAIQLLHIYIVEVELKTNSEFNQNDSDNLKVN